MPLNFLSEMKFMINWKQIILVKVLIGHYILSIIPETQLSVTVEIAPI